MNKEILYEILNSKSESLSLADIDSILNEELDKSPEEMDTDLVELCLDALLNADEKKLNTSKHKFRITKILIAAVIFVLIIGTSIPACAKFFNVHLPEGVVSFYKDCFNLDLSDKEYVQDITAQLEKDGVEEAAFPNLIFDIDTEISEYVVKNTAEEKYIRFDFENTDINGYVVLKIRSKDAVVNVDQKKEASEFKKADSLNVNGVEVLVFANDDVSHIMYMRNNVEYNIYIYTDYETACKIAKTI